MKDLTSVELQSRTKDNGVKWCNEGVLLMICSLPGINLSTK